MWYTTCTDAVPRTPSTVLCQPVAVANLETWQRKADQHGKAVRPHFKAHKTLALSRTQLDQGAVGFEVSRLREIEWIIREGLMADFVLSWIHIKPDLWQRVAELVYQGHRITVDVDSIELAAGYAAAAERCSVVLPVRVQVDSGLRGCDEGAVFALCAMIARSPHLELTGLTAYRSIYTRAEERNWLPFDVLGRNEAELLVGLRDRLHQAGFGEDIRILCGSTAVTRGALAVEGVDEVAGASYVLADWGLAQIGVCATQDIAVGVVATVTSNVGGIVTIDAGADVFGRWDPYPGIAEPVAAATPNGRVLFDKMEANSTSSKPVDGPVPAVGSRLFVYPGQVCELVNVPGEFLVVDHGGDITDAWPRLSTGYYSSTDPVI
ncbi:D-serine deaminase-like pyridoxal phosphate-dependent protein [Nocardia sp. GAS34]|uniref:alanine racemase n=1 Tax=unclassified Nocardia TaxID=2637762 RepID=UPI003D1B06CF